jgi:hypothetical protein
LNGTKSLACLKSERNNLKLWKELSSAYNTQVILPQG